MFMPILARKQKSNLSKNTGFKKIARFLNIIYNDYMHVLYISKNTIEIFKKYQKVGEVAWTVENLPQNLSQIKSTFSSKFRVILSDEFISVHSLLLTSKESKNRSTVQSKFQSIISQNLQETVWDYKIVAGYNRLKLTQLIYLSPGFFNVFRQAVQTSKIKIELLESFSTAICHFLPPKKLVLLSYQDLLVLSFNQTPIYSKVLSKKLNQENIDEIFAYTKERFQTLPQQILFSPAGDVAFNQFDFGNIHPEFTNINPLRGIIHSQNSTGSDAQTTRLEISQSKKIVFPKIMFLIPLILFGIGGLFFIFKTKNTDNNSQLLEPQPTIVISPTVTATPTKNISDYKIQVLNGTGTLGEAGKVTDLLKKNNFSVESVGNADNYNFTQTEVAIKSSVPSDITDLINDSLKGNYSVKITDKKISGDSEFDIIITTGDK